MPEATLTDVKTATPSAADAAVAASTDAATKAAADKAIADKAAADATAANAAKVKPEFEAQAAAEKAAAEKAELDRLATEKAAREAVKYDLKVPEGSKLDAAFVERTAAIARELGLDQKGAEKLLTERAKEAADETARRETLVAALKPGGEIWEKRDVEYRTSALKDKDLGNGDQKTLDVAVEKVQIALSKFGDDELRADLKESGWGSKPSVLRLLARIGRAMGEGAQIAGHASGGTAKKTDAQVMFPNMYHDDGSPKT